MKQVILFYLVALCTYNIDLQAQNNNNALAKEQKESIFSTTTSGLQYKILKDSVGTNYPEAGGFITFWFEMRTSNDSVFDTQFADPNPVGIPTPEAKHKPSIEEGLWLLTEGDSALFLLNVDSLYHNTFFKDAPTYIPQGSMVGMIIKMGRVYTKHFVDSVMAIQEAKLLAQKVAERNAYRRDSIEIQRYLIEHKLKGEVIDGGVYIVKLKKRSKTQPYIVKVETVETTYIGKLLIEGTEFDRSPAGKYVEFTVGIGEVIKGWDYAFQRLKLGEKALILIPSGMAYGSRGAGDAIPPNAPLLFEVDIKK